MPRRPLALAAGLLFALALAGCGSKSNDGSNARVLNLVSGATNVTVTAAGTTVLSGGSFETLGSYAGISSGTVEFKATTPGTPGAFVDVTYSLSSGVDYTWVPFGTPGAATAVMMGDSFQNPGTGNMAIRVLNTSVVVPSVDLYLTAPGADIATATPVVSSAATGSPTTFLSTPAGTFQVRLTVAGTKEVVYDATPATFGGQTGQTIVAYGRGSGKLLNAAILVSNTTGAIVNNTLAQLKVANATSAAAPLNVFVGGALAFPGLAYPTVAPYQTVAAGARSIVVESAATPGAALLTTTPTLAGASDTTVVLAGPAGAMTATVVTDSNQTVSPGRAQVRVINASPAYPAIDVYANFGRFVSGVASGSASAYTFVDAAASGTPYTFDFYVAGSTTPILGLPGQSLAARGVYTLFLMGSGPTLAGVLTQDR